MDPKKDKECNRKTNLLVYQKPSGQRTERPCQDPRKKPRLPICAPKARSIRVCTGAEMKKMCPPKLCKCPQPTNRMLLMLVFGIKAAIATGAMWVTYDIGIWGTTEDTHEMYKKYCTLTSGGSLHAATKWDPPSCEAEKVLFKTHRPDTCDTPPIDIERKAFTMQNQWNYVVESVFSGIVGFPFNVMGMFNKEEQKKEPVCDEVLTEKNTITPKYK